MAGLLKVVILAVFAGLLSGLVLAECDGPHEEKFTDTNLEDHRTPAVISQCRCTEAAKVTCQDMQGFLSVSYPNEKPEIMRVLTGCKCLLKSKDLVNGIPDTETKVSPSPHSCQAGEQKITDLDVDREPVRHCECSEESRRKGCRNVQNLQWVNFNDGTGHYVTVNVGCNCDRSGNPGNLVNLLIH